MYNRFHISFNLIVIISVFGACQSRTSEKSVELVENIWQPKGKSIIYKSELGSRKNIVLPDGSTAILGSATTLTVPEDYNNSSREIAIDGMALLETIADSTKPLIIHTKHLINTTAGGIFRIIAYHTGEGETIEVQSGSLKAEKAYKSQFDEPEILQHHEMVMINHTIDLIEKEKLDTTDLATWKLNRLSFNNASITNVARQLESWFGITVVLDGDLSKLPTITNTFENYTLQQILDTLSETYHFKYSIKNDEKVILK